MLRATAGQWTVVAIKDNEPFAGDAANITAKIRKDGGDRVATDDVNPTESEDGQYDFNITASENNAYKLNLYPESSTAGVTVIALPPVIYTESDAGSTPSPTPVADGDVPFGLDGPVAMIEQVVISNVPTEGAKAGTIQLPLVIGDDYLSANGRGLSWTVEIPTGTTISGSSCVLRFVQAAGSCDGFEIEFEGDITAADTAGYAILTFDMPTAETSTIANDEYFFFVEWIGDAGEVITKVFNSQLVKWRDKVA